MQPLEDIYDAQLHLCRIALRPYMHPADRPSDTLEKIRRAHAERPVLSETREAFTLAQQAEFVHRMTGEEDYLWFALELADYVVQTYHLASGGFIEWERCYWIEDHEKWRPNPWGTAFRGNEMVDTFDVLNEHMPAEMLRRWQESLDRLAAWICGNPWVGTMVYNCAIDLCRLLWRVGVRRESQDWVDRALQDGRSRIERDIDRYGWCHGEHGVSGHYQWVGASLTGFWAWESGLDDLQDVFKRMFQRFEQVVGPGLEIPGNIGSRSSDRAPNRRVKHTVLLGAAMGLPAAAGLLEAHGQPDWSLDQDLWAEAVQTESGPLLRGTDQFETCDLTVVNRGPFTAVFSEYERARWARGFIDLWHSSLETAVFATRHALATPAGKRNEPEASDWAGFPHVFLQHEDTRYHSQREVSGLSLEDGEDMTLVRWTEQLVDSDGNSGGRMECSCRFTEEHLEVEVHLSGLAGRATADFHVLAEPTSRHGIWEPRDWARIAAGQMPHEGGMWMDVEMEPPAEPMAIQVERGFALFQVTDAPQQTKAVAGLRSTEPLHAKSTGGVRLRLALPEGLNEAHLKVLFSAQG